MTQSETITQSITAAQQQITTSERRIECIGVELTEKAGDADFASDRKDLAGLLKEQAACTQTVRLLTLRIERLRAQHAEAVASEHRARLEAISHAVAVVVLEGAAEAAECVRHMERVTALVARLHARVVSHGELTQEGHYLATLLETEAPHFTKIPLPDPARLIRLAETLTATARQPVTQWEIRRRQLLETRQREMPQPQQFVADITVDPSTPLLPDTHKSKYANLYPMSLHRLLGGGVMFNNINNLHPSTVVAA